MPPTSRTTTLTRFGSAGDSRFDAPGTLPPAATKARTRTPGFGVRAVEDREIHCSALSLVVAASDMACARLRSIRAAFLPTSFAI